MRFRKITHALLFSALLLAVPAAARAAGHIAPVGVTTQQASQLIVWYDETQSVALEGFSFFQVTNGSSSTGVNIHVQIFADDANDADDRCREHNFTDTLTASDTVVYVMGDLDDPDMGPPPFGGNNAGNPIAIDVIGTRGFIVVTAVNQITIPRRAISHNHLFASIHTFYNANSALDETAHSINAMGREAVEFATGALTPDGVLLDGVTNGLRLIQPSFLIFGFTEDVVNADNEAESNVISIAFTDNYSDPAGEYRAEPATAVWDPLYFDQFEVGTSCQQHTQTCFVTIGIDNVWDTEIDEQGADTDYGSPRLCPANSIDDVRNDLGWVKIAISGVSGLANNMGIIAYNEEFDDPEEGLARWMHAE